MELLIFGTNARRSALSIYSRNILLATLRKAGLKSAKITSTMRTPADQARAMYANLESRGISSQKQLYGPYGDKVIETYDQLKKSGMSKQAILAGMTRRIEDLGPRNVSAHCGDPTKLNVVDIAPSSLSNRSAFEKAVRADKRISKFLKPPADPAYHLEISQLSRS